MTAGILRRRNRPDIARHWQADRRRAANICGMARCCCARPPNVSDGVLSASLVKTDYASFIAWRDWGRPDATVLNCFGVPAVFSSDGALLFGVMNDWTLNAGKAYPPSGTLEPKDVRGDGSGRRAGLDAHRAAARKPDSILLQARAGEMVAIFEGPRLAIARRYRLCLELRRDAGCLRSPRRDRGEARTRRHRSGVEQFTNRFKNAGLCARNHSIFSSLTDADRRDIPVRHRGNRDNVPVAAVSSLRHNLAHETDIPHL